MSEREPSYGTVSQQLGDAVQYSGGDNSDILKMLALTKKEKPVTSWGDVDFGTEEKLPQFRAARDENNNINFFSLDKDSQKYVRSQMNDADLSEMFGRDLSASEEKYVRGQVFKDPSLLSYFMGIGEEPGRREMKKIKTWKRGKSGGGGNGTTTGGAGSKSLAKEQRGNRFKNFFAWCKLDGTCKE